MTEQKQEHQTKECHSCLQDFTPKDPKEKFCSPRCAANKYL